MIERNEKGKQARQYFIECEKNYIKSQITQPQQNTDSEIKYFYLSSPHYFCQPYFRWIKTGHQYLMCVNDLLKLTDFDKHFNNIAGGLISNKYRCRRKIFSLRFNLIAGICNFKLKL